MSTASELQLQYLEKRGVFREELRRQRMLAHMTQPELVRAVGNGLSINVYKKYEWKGGDSIPDEERLTRLVDALGDDARGLIELWSTADAARLAWRGLDRFDDRSRRVERYEPWKGYTFRELFARSLDSVIAHCISQPSSVGTVIGWRHFLENDQLQVTSMSSAYGLRILLLANHAGSVPSVGRIRDSILKMENEGGGWSARTQNRLARVEAYGPTLHALRLAGLSDEALEERVSHYEEILDPEHDPATWESTTVNTIACSTLCSVHPESFRIPQLLEALAGSAVENEFGVHWTESLLPKRREDLYGSVPHTARAIAAIAKAPAESTDGLEELVVRAVRWLESQVEHLNYLEQVERQNESDPEFLNMRHFSSAWVARALSAASKWTEPNLQTLKFTEDLILKSVGEDGLWRWQSGAAPIWMTYQGLKALEELARTQHDLTRS